jgi:hypothetical protein
MRARFVEKFDEPVRQQLGRCKPLAERTSYYLWIAFQKCSKRIQAVVTKLSAGMEDERVAAIHSGEPRMDLVSTALRRVDRLDPHGFGQRSRFVGGRSVANKDLVTLLELREQTRETYFDRRSGIERRDDDEQGVVSNRASGHFR